MSKSTATAVSGAASAPATAPCSSRCVLATFALLTTGVHLVFPLLPHTP